MVLIDKGLVVPFRIAPCGERAFWTLGVQLSSLSYGSPQPTATLNDAT